jgi:hypothetical protein
VRIRFFVLMSLIAFGSACTAQKTEMPVGWEQFELSDLAVRAAFPCRPDKTPGVTELTGNSGIASQSCETEGLRFLIARRNHLKPYSDDTPREIFDNDRKFFRGIFGEPGEYSESDDCESVHPCHISDVSLGGMRVRLLLIVTKRATIEAMVATVSKGSAGQEPLLSFDKKWTTFVEALEVASEDDE